MFHMFTPVEQENIWVLLPGLVEGTSILLDYGGLLWVDDGGGGHDNGSTFPWRGLMKQKKTNLKCISLNLWSLLNVYIVK